MYRSSGVDLRSFVVAYEFKLSLPFAAAVFVLVGTGCSLGARKNGRFFSVAASIVLAFAYYLVSVSCGLLAIRVPVACCIRLAANAIF